MLAQPVENMVVFDPMSIKRVLILSDNDGLSKAVELNLQATQLPKGVQLETIRCVPDTAEAVRDQVAEENLNLIVVALSSASSEPALALAKNSLLHRVGYTPLLIISQKTSNFGPTGMISHMDYPFDIDQLQNAIKDTLRSTMEG
ncbi:MAG TPA: hypothetical protein DEH25_13225 [Chloroflexi bacterium]|nr:hypothetical protein [Chloroflexota bacterium]HBY07638.1 hypothetical protein [Chloroflexota bacterium]